MKLYSGYSKLVLPLHNIGLFVPEIAAKSFKTFSVIQKEKQKYNYFIPPSFYFPVVNYR